MKTNENEKVLCSFQSPVYLLLIHPNDIMFYNMMTVALSERISEIDLIKESYYDVDVNENAVFIWGDQTVTNDGLTHITLYKNKNHHVSLEPLCADFTYDKGDIKFKVSLYFIDGVMIPVFEDPLRGVAPILKKHTITFYCNPVFSKDLYENSYRLLMKLYPISNGELTAAAKEICDEMSDYCSLSLFITVEPKDEEDTEPDEETLGRQYLS